MPVKEREVDAVDTDAHSRIRGRSRGEGRERQENNIWRRLCCGREFRGQISIVDKERRSGQLVATGGTLDAFKR